MSGAAQRNDMVETFDFPVTGTESASALKEVVAERLAAHRSRLADAHAEQAMQAARETAAQRLARAEARNGSSRVREAVAARYKESLSYREYLAAEAERAIQQAQAEADIAARNAEAVAESQMQLLQELEQWNQPEPGPREAAIAAEKAHVRDELAHALADIAMGARELMEEPSFAVPSILPFDAPAPAPRKPEVPAGEISTGNLTVRLYEEISANRTPGKHDMRLGRHTGKPEPGEFELDHLEQEIEFRRTPEFEPHIIETTPIPANLIEFPRQLIAPRKARPRLAEGPLREDSSPEPQLRIFEVEAEQISMEPPSSEPVTVAEWQTLTLGGAAEVVPNAPAEAQTHFSTQPQTAPLELRLMATAVDGACIIAAFVVFAALVVEISGPALRALTRPLLGASAGGVFTVLFLLYQMLFFTFAEATPGMLYARIGLCTFSDANPSRKAMRRRVLATLLAACPLAIGIIWTFLDEERLGWHDRMSRMYQRAY